MNEPTQKRATQGKKQTGPADETTYKIPAVRNVPRPSIGPFAMQFVYLHRGEETRNFHGILLKDGKPVAEVGNSGTGGPHEIRCFDGNWTKDHPLFTELRQLAVESGLAKEADFEVEEVIIDQLIELQDYRKWALPRHKQGNGWFIIEVTKEDNGLGLGIPETAWRAFESQAEFEAFKADTKNRWSTADLGDDLMAPPTGRMVPAFKKGPRPAISGFSLVIEAFDNQPAGYTLKGVLLKSDVAIAEVMNPAPGQPFQFTFYDSQQAESLAAELVKVAPEAELIAPTVGEPLQNIIHALILLAAMRQWALKQKKSGFAWFVVRTTAAEASSVKPKRGYSSFTTRAALDGYTSTTTDLWVVPNLGKDLLPKDR